ncbi:hypothetical protein VTH8203_03362 [Vibrio thalassae]|uniref:Uncharacterized protein n=1 Tax=Vibrio thalassae TaxID=1243014 RepID=A0A240EM63_9VIBR|nr:hypothetical protein VTH8203_03362 [Vibrio thalassae]
MTILEASPSSDTTTNSPLLFKPHVIPSISDSSRTLKRTTFSQSWFSSAMSKRATPLSSTVISSFSMLITSGVKLVTETGAFKELDVVSALTSLAMSPRVAVTTTGDVCGSSTTFSRYSTPSKSKVTSTSISLPYRPVSSCPLGKSTRLSPASTLKLGVKEAGKSPPSNAVRSSVPVLVCILSGK